MANGLLEDVRKRVLQNGLTAVVHPDRSLPVVCLNVFVRVGSNCESDDVWGWSHGIEHMLFKGTARRKVGDIAREVQRLGGSLNAGTGYEFTNYHITLPSDGFAHALDIHADVLEHSAFDEDALERERKVLIEELQMYEDVPDGFGRSWNEMMRLAFSTHPYRRSIIGSIERLQHTSRDQILDHFRRYYVPGNIVYAVAGDVEAERALDEIESRLGDMSGSPAPNAVPAPEPRQDRFRYGAILGPVEMAYYKIAYHVPEERHPDTPPLQVLLHVLGAGRSSRLHQRVLENKGLVSAIDTMELSGRDPGVCLVDAVTDAPKLTDAVVATYDEVHRFQDRAVSDEDLEKALNNVRVGFLSALETVEGQASVMGQFEALGDYRWAAEYPNRIASVTAEDIVRVARHYLGFDQSSLLTYTEGEWSELDRSGEPLMRDRLASAIAPVGPAPPPSGGRTSTPPSFARARSSARSGDTRVETLSGGARLVIRTNPKHPMVALAGYVSGGARFETDADQGVAILSARSLMKGTASRSSEALAEELDRYGITLTPFADSDTMGFYVEALNEHLDRALDVFADILVSPTFPAEEVDRERRLLLSDLAQREDDTVSATLTRFRRKLYGDHPYGRDPLGTEATVQGLSREQLERWHRRFFVPGRLTLAAVGDVSPDTLVAGLNARLAALPAGEGEHPERRVPRAEPGLYQIDRDRQQSVIVVGFPAPSMHADERYALLVLNGVLSGMGARLFTELRDKRHLCYFTSSGYSAHDEGGSFTAYLGTSPAQVPVALEALTSELLRARSEPPSDEELTRAINGITGSHLISLQRNGSQAARFARLEALGVSHERVLSFPQHVRTVTREEVQRVAEQVIDLDGAVTTVLAPGALDGATRVE